MRFNGTRMIITDDHFKQLISRLGEMKLEEAMMVNRKMKERSYLERRLVSPAYPSVWEIETTNRCGMACTHCPRPYLFNRDLTDMGIDLLKKIIDQLQPFAQNIYREKRADIQFMHYGEPALYTYFGESIAYARQKGFSVLVSSTSSVFHDRAVKEAVETQLDRLWMIFDGMDDETFKKVRGKTASFTRGLEQLKKLLEYKKERSSLLPAVSVIMIKHPYNRHQWRQFREFFAGMKGVSPVLAHFSTFSSRVSQINRLQQLIVDDPEEQGEVERVAILNRNICYYPWHSVSVMADGRAVPCCRDLNGDYVLGDLNHQSLVEIWNGEKIKRLREDFIKGSRDNPLCRSCKEGSLEIGVP
jgi:radical SAM protein with 4Fe4S-binding SPASM domain